MSDVAAVFQIGSLGDSVVSLPTLLSIRELLPTVSDYLLVSRFDSSSKVVPNEVFDMAWKAKILVNYSGPSKGVKGLWSIVSVMSQLRYYRPRYCVYLMPSQRSPKQVERDKHFFRAGGIKDLVGFRALSSQELTPRAAPDRKDTEAYLRFRRVWNDAADDRFDRYSAIPLLEPSSDARGSVQEWLVRHRRYTERRLLIVCPYSNCNAKDMPDEAVVDLLPRLERSANVETLLLGSKKDFQRAEAAILRSGTGLNACGAFSLAESAALLKSCSLAICTDSGPMHVAGAMGVPSLIMFSRVNQQLCRWFPLGHDHTILYRELECAGCRSVRCPIEGHPCMRDITSDQILSAALRKLNNLPAQWDSPNGTRVLAW